MAGTFPTKVTYYSGRRFRKNLFNTKSKLTRLRWKRPRVIYSAGRSRWTGWNAAREITRRFTREIMSFFTRSNLSDVLSVCRSTNIRILSHECGGTQIVQYHLQRSENFWKMYLRHTFWAQNRMRTSICFLMTQGKLAITTLTPILLWDSFAYTSFLMLPRTQLECSITLPFSIFPFTPNQLS